MSTRTLWASIWKMKIPVICSWRRGRRPQFYGVANVGKGCHNRDEVYANGSFDVAGAVAELTARGHNIRDKVREVLIAGLNAYR